MLKECLSEKKVLILDGALATELEKRGCNINDTLWSAKILAEQPEKIQRVHYDYYAVGADIGISSSYQATVCGFEQKGYTKQQAKELIKNSIRLLKRARTNYWENEGEKSGRIYPIAAASIGPYGAYLSDGSEYTGKYLISYNGLVEFHRERMILLEEEGTDIFACETIPSLEEAKAILMAMETISTPCWISFSCKDEKHVCDGTPIKECAIFLQQQPKVEAIGVNCTPPEYIEGLIREIRCVSNKPIVVYGNSGEVYDAKEKIWTGAPCGYGYSQWAPKWYEAGANIIGGCCRTGPEDIKKIKQWSLTL